MTAKTKTTTCISRIALSGLLALVTIHPAHADDRWLPAKKGMTFLGVTAAGVALGGPVGLVGGALVATWMDGTIDTAAQAEDSLDQLTLARADLEQSQSRLAQASADLEEVRSANLQYAQLVLDQLELEMLFKTNATELTPTGQQRLARLAEFLAANPAIAIRLDGYADPRGEETYNEQLSLGRVSHVARTLAEYGVDAQRIESFSHGASQSSAGQGDYDAYALERAVKINLSQPPVRGLASTD
ncbi:MAG: OmpA family protein [Halieaceae bacterium]